MNQPISSLPLADKVKHSILQSGYSVLGEVCPLTESSLATICSISAKDAKEAVRIIREAQLSYSGSSLKPVSALQLLYTELSSPPLTTFCRSVDNLLHGGILPGILTEVSGSPGVGKTQFCMQLSLTCQLPTALGGFQQRSSSPQPSPAVLYVDTEGSLTIERLREIAEHLVQYLHNLPARFPKELECDEMRDLLNVDYFLRHVHYFRAVDAIQLMAFSHRVELLCDSLQTEHQQQVRLIIVDSVAFHFRGDKMDAPLRNRALALLARKLSQVAVSQQACVLLTNHLTTKFTTQDLTAAHDEEETEISSRNLGEAHPMPALGDMWSHFCAVRLLLVPLSQPRLADRSRRQRHIVSVRLLKHPFKQETPAESVCQITVAGVRDYQMGSAM